MLTISLYEILLIEIKCCNDVNEPIWLTKLIDNLDASRDQIIRHVDNLIDFDMLKGGYCETKKGRAGYRYYITEIGEEQLSRILL